MEYFGNDTCVEILNLRKFYLCIGFQLFVRNLIDGTQPTTSNDCIYEGRTFAQGKHSEYMTYFLKDERFKHQCEHRMIYPSRIGDHTLKPMILKVPEIKNILKIHKF